MIVDKSGRYGLYDAILAENRYVIERFCLSLNYFKTISSENFEYLNAAKRYKTTLDFGENARCVSSGELLAFNSRWSGVVQTFPRNDVEISMMAEYIS